MDATEHDVSAAGAGLGSHFVPPQRIGRVNPNADDIALLYGREVEWFQGLVRDERIAIAEGRRRRQNVQPTRGDYGHAERPVAWVYQMNAHETFR